MAHLALACKECIVLGRPEVGALVAACGDGKVIKVADGDRRCRHPEGRHLKLYVHNQKAQRCGTIRRGTAIGHVRSCPAAGSSTGIDLTMVHGRY